MKLVPNPNVDWSQAPADADAWEMTESGTAIWSQVIAMEATTIYDTDQKAGLTTAAIKPAPAFGWTGDWKQSYTFRPERTVKP